MFNLIKPNLNKTRAMTMAWYCSGSTNTELIENLFKAGLIQNERVKDAMIGVDRAHYAPSRAYSDSPQPIGYGATISAPHMHGHACEYLIKYLKPGARVLDIGSGSGYLTHVLANLVTDSNTHGQVIGIDHIPELTDLARTNMNKSKKGSEFQASATVKFITGDGRLGWKEGAPYDAIHVGAAADHLHPTLVDQLHAPGRLFIPVESKDESDNLNGGQYIWVVDKKEDGSIHKEKVFQVSYVPLTDAPRG
ncbi:Protein-L-isoaspartate(D-aspartate) O-methyltransferase [Penicillium cf. griseofulvum]|uniref:Protein-L-isoaspartate O-methyltransferase n=1 Tax=Penicillium cf. griseofulvum TaxID=2972120 RepID=A0A9W9MZC3_9EURO|nr:Protein-L-isoaspartate(D-aspartate) O-methyltransferase [Penicillium cf. griseofulvum]KAJ5421658.1 Protein-L-isoaspartate(D-aspartate) O-methyltransferase [Penicillium cf. griseofulvum]KAJ5424899.1 Protein-L-isoaspartate(D-aspartate) O-methyltransferase [Penicillium cf. griseofulvum]